MRRLSVVISASMLILSGVFVVACGGDTGGGGAADAVDTQPPPGDTNPPPGCQSDGDCKAGEKCQDGTCTPTVTGCTSDADCAAGETCENGECKSGTCEPLCLDGWQCGPNGCGGSCGECAAGTQCNPAQHVCETIGPPPAELAEFGEPCGRKGECQPRMQDENNDWIDNPQWPTCIHAQCETGYCSEPVCGKNCTITKDEVDSGGTAGPDGIDDPDSPFNDCAGAVDGIMGSQWTCVNYAPLDQGTPYTLCEPGTTFKMCGNDGDCPDGEHCNLMYVGGTYNMRCAITAKGGKDVSSTCNFNPDDGELELCKASCYGIGCVGPCKEDADCSTFDAGCGAGGTCTDDPSIVCASDVDCSAWTCDQDYEYKDSSGATVAAFPTCWPRYCDKNANCKDTDFYCRPFVNGEEGDALDWENLCVHSPANSAGLGEDCEDNPDDNIPKPKCGKGWCMGGKCTSICETNADCANGGPSFRCDYLEFSFDHDDDGITDQYLPLGFCMNYPGSNTECTSDGDCTGGGLEACQFIQTKESGEFDGTGICVTVAAVDGDIGDPCGGNSGVSCKSGFCFGVNDQTPGWCSAICSKIDDCPQDAAGVTLGNFSGSYRLACVPYRNGPAGTFSSNPALNKTDDDVMIGLCFPAAMALGKVIPGTGAIVQFLTAPESTMAACNPDYSCTAANQACAAFPVAHGVTGFTGVEYRCIDNTQSVQPDPAVAPTDVPANAAFGTGCDLDLDDPKEANPRVCQDLYCVPDAGDDGYCTKLCNIDTDCGADWVCDNMTLIDRKVDDVTAGVCRKQTSCIPCASNNDCGGDHVCINNGGSGLLSNYVCSKPCSVETDCSGWSGGASCAESLDPKGNPEGVTACVDSNICK